MKSQEELEEFLKACDAVSGFGLSNGPCPLKSERKECAETCSIDSEDRKMCCDNWDARRGCCAECSFPSTIRWVLGSEDDPTKNGQNKIIQAFRDLGEEL